MPAGEDTAGKEEKTPETPRKPAVRTIIFGETPAEGGGGEEDEPETREELYEDFMAGTNDN